MMKRTFFTLAILMVLAMALVGCKIEVAVPDDGKQDTDITTPDDEVQEADIETAKAYLGAFDDALFLKDLHAAMKGEKADGLVTTMVAEGIAFDDDKTELTIPLTLTGYDFDGKGDEATAGLYTRTATGKATLVLTGKTDQGLFKAEAYKVKALDVKLTVGEAEGYIALTLPEMQVTAEEITGAITGATIDIAVDAEGNASGIVDVDTPVFGAAKGEIGLNGVKADISALVE